PRRPHGRRGVGGGGVFPRRHGRGAPLPRRAHAGPRPHPGGQPPARPRGARPSSEGRGGPRGGQAHRRVAPGPRHPRDPVPGPRPGCLAPEPAGMTIPLYDVVLGLLVLGVAAWTVTARSTFAAVAGFVAYGLLVSLAWVRLSAVDAALTEAAI